MVGAETDLRTGVRFSGAVSGGRLRLSVRYNQSRYAPEDVEALCVAFQKAISDITLHCAGISDSVRTASDAGLEDFDDQELEILNRLSEFDN